jgi:hypothetical protein
MNPRHRRLVIPVALGALILIVVLAAVLCAPTRTTTTASRSTGSGR